MFLLLHWLTVVPFQVHSPCPLSPGLILSISDTNMKKQEEVGESQGVGHSHSHCSLAGCALTVTEIFYLRQWFLLAACLIVRDSTSPPSFFTLQEGNTDFLWCQFPGALPSLIIILSYLYLAHISVSSFFIVLSGTNLLYLPSVSYCDSN